MRERKYESIIDELVFISRVSEGSISIDWLKDQPIKIRKSLLDSAKDEVKEREARMNQK